MPIGFGLIRRHQKHVVQDLALHTYYGRIRTENLWAWVAGQGLIDRDFASLFTTKSQNPVWECAFDPRGKHRTRSQCRLQSCTLMSTTPQVQGRIEVCNGLLIWYTILRRIPNVLASAFNIFNMDSVGMPTCRRGTNVFGGVAQHLLWISSQIPPRKKQMPEVWT